jgi:MFS transporter, DHA1 family, inner membrane transport protein
MAYLTNSAVNFLNTHYALHALAINGAGVFWGVYLLKAGVPAPAVFGALALQLAARFVFRPAILLLAPRFGLRALVAFGTVFSALQYLFLAEVRGVDWMLLAVCIVGAIGDTFYWTCYHAYFAALGDTEHRGKQISVREAAGAVSSIVGPLLVGWALVVLGPRVAFGAATVVHALSALPFFFTPDVTVKHEAPGAFWPALPSVLVFAADGWICAGYLFAWQIALFIALGESFTAFGGALALAATVGAIAGLGLGQHIDAGRGLRAVWLTFGSLAALTVLRAASTESVALAVIANALGALVICLYLPTVMTSVYNQSKRSPCPLRFHVATEGGWDIGGSIGCLAAAALLLMGAPLSSAILLSLLGCAVGLVLVRRYYAEGELASLTAPAGLPREPGSAATPAV